MFAAGFTGTRSVSRAHATVQRRACIARAAAAPPSHSQPYSDIALLPAGERAKLARQWGFDYIGKELPDDVRLRDIVQTLPKEVFEINNARGWLTCLTSLITFPLSLYLVHITPAALLPISWAIAGTAFTGWFVIGHDCGHRTFNTHKVVEDIVGNFFFAPLLYPFEPWRIKHNQHHAFTNKLVDDTAWHPVMKDEATELSGSPGGKVVKGFLGSPFKLFASIFHWLIWHFDASKFTKAQMPKVIVSWASCAAFAAVAFPLIVSNFGWFGIVKYWLGPWLGYHFWMSTFTIVHHTAPHIPFKEGKEWNAAKSQLSGTVHCNYPGYNLRKATESLRQNWGEYMTEATFNWRLVKTIVTQCHVYDEEKNYVPFDYEEEKPFFALQRKYLPDRM